MRQRMNSVANADRLTGLFNRRFFDHQLAFELQRAGRYGHSVSLLLLDIDHFKQVNDRHGHQKGDDVLATVGALVESHTRSSDIAARYGGEEMAVILPETNREQAAIAAEKLRRRIENDIEGRAGLAVTVSIGVATAVPSETKRGPAAGTQTPAGLIEAADQALYRAKELGRNQVVMR
jgi:diguanylate cyclase (GGDEF)-like protein